MLITTNKLTGPALDWAVAKCEGVPNVRTVRKTGKTCVYGRSPGLTSHTSLPPIGRRLARLLSGRTSQFALFSTQSVPNLDQTFTGKTDGLHTWSQPLFG